MFFCAWTFKICKCANMSLKSSALFKTSITHFLLSYYHFLLTRNAFPQKTDHFKTFCTKCNTWFFVYKNDAPLYNSIHCIKDVRVHMADICACSGLSACSPSSSTNCVRKSTPTQWPVLCTRVDAGMIQLQYPIYMATSKRPTKWGRGVGALAGRGLAGKRAMFPP